MLREELEADDITLDAYRVAALEWEMYLRQYLEQYGSVHPELKDIVRPIAKYEFKHPIDEIQRERVLFETQVSLILALERYVIDRYQERFGPKNYVEMEANMQETLNRQAQY